MNGCLAEEPAICFTKANIEAMFKKEHERASDASIALDLKPPYLDKVADK